MRLKTALGVVAAVLMFSLARTSSAQPGAAAAAEASGVQASGRPLRPAGLHLGLISLEVEELDVRGLSLSLLADRVDRVSGVQWSIGLNEVRGRSRGVQLTSIANIAGDDFGGVQLSSGLNWVKGRSRGVQLAGTLNVAGGGGGGVQVAGANIAGGQYGGVQLGLLNAAAGLGGLQLAALNIGGDISGMQLGAVNLAGAVSGVQLAAVNVARDSAGTQVGAVNVARRARGLSVGLVNVARQHDGEALGLVNIIGNGIHDVAVYSTDVMLSNVSVKLGGRHLYTSWSMGYHPGNDLGAGAQRFDSDSRRLGLGLGLGYRIDLDWGRVKFLELELSGMSVVSKMRNLDDDPPLLAASRAIMGIELTRQLTLIAGLTENVAIGWHNRDLDLSLTPLEDVERKGGTTIRTFPGALLGLQL